MACTTLLVGKKASFDGSTIIARNEDSPNGVFCPKKFVVVKPEDQPRHYKAVLTHLEVDLPDNPMRYSAVPNALDNEGIWAAAGVNEKNVAMTATETISSNARVLGADPLVEFVPAQGKPGEEGYVPEVVGGISEEDMVTLTLPYINSAREGVQRLGSLLEQYGTYEMNGIAFSDTNEIWWLETIGGHHWIARRVPDDSYVVMPNQLGIDYFDLNDAFGEQKEFMCSSDLREWMDEYNLNLTYTVDSDYCECDHCTCDDECGCGCQDGEACTCDDACDKDGACGCTAHECECDDDCDCGCQDGEACTCDEDCCADCACECDDEYEKGIFNPRDAFGSHCDADHVYNTPRAWIILRYLTPSIFADSDCPWGPESDDLPWCMKPEHKITMEEVKYALSMYYQGTEFNPYSPLGTPETRGLYRPIGINRNSHLAAIQLRGNKPEAICALQWMAYGSNAFNALVPYYANINDTPEYLANTTGHVTTESFYWTNRIIGALADAHFKSCANHIEHYQDAVGAQGWRMVNETDKKVTEQKLSYKDAAAELEKANAAITAMVKRETDKTLNDVLFTASLTMHNSYGMSDH